MPRLVSAPVVSVDASDPNGGAEELVMLSSFLQPMKDRVEPIVLSLTGPVTAALALVRGGTDVSYAEELAMTAVSAKARALLELASTLVPLAPVLLMLEEPALANSMHPTFPLAPDEIESLVSEVVEPLTDDAMVGVQVNGRADWAMLFRTGISVLGAPVTARLDTAASELSAFLRDGGFIAWGAVPVDEPLGASADRLWKRLSALWAELSRLGIDPLLLRERSIITPTADLGAFGVSQAERVIRLTAELSEKVFRQVVGARLSIGA
jgi:hypothetical protein